MDDPHRRGLGSDNAEDTLRIVQNGPPAADFDGVQIVPVWRHVFGHNQVKSAADKKQYLEESKSFLRQQRLRYKEDVEFSAAKKLARVNNYRKRKLVLAMARGSTQPAVRKSHKKQRTALRASSKQDEPAENNGNEKEEEEGQDLQEIRTWTMTWKTLQRMTSRTCKNLCNRC